MLGCPKIRPTKAPASTEKASRQPPEREYFPAGSIARPCHSRDVVYKPLSIAVGPFERTGRLRRSDKNIKFEESVATARLFVRPLGRCRCRRIDLPFWDPCGKRSRGARRSQPRSRQRHPF